MKMPRLAQRELGLACVAILAGAVALAVTARTRATTRCPCRAAVGSYVALAGSSGSKAIGRHTSCGGTIEAATIGVAQPTLPCGTRIYLTYRGKRVLTQVIDRDPHQSDRQFDLTEALAGVSG